MYAVPTVLNWHEQAAGGATGGNSTGDTPVPGIPGTTGNGDYFVMEATGFMQLPAGTHRLGVNSDDGFRLTFGTGINPLDRFTPLQVAILDGTRGFANTEVNVTVSTAGIYPFRLLWWQGGGGVNVEFLSVDRDTGRHVLVNDIANTALAIPAIRPFGDAVGAVVANAGSETSGMVINGVPVTPVITDLDGGRKRVLYTPSPAFASGSPHTAGLVYAGTTNSWTFTVITNVAINAGTAVATSQLDPTKVGFRARG